MSDIRTVAVASVIAVAPFAIVLIVALIRGYSIHVSARRDKDSDR